MKLLRLPPNLVERPYRGGSRLAAFRRTSIGDRDRVPEDWVGSTTNVFGRGELGLTRLPDGTTLRDAISRDPDAYLGPSHTAVLGADPGLLVKLIDAQQRLSVHLHPDRQFARQHLGLPYGKTEAWYILEARDGAVVYFGFRDPTDADELLSVVERGGGGSLLERLNRLEVQAGDVIFVPAGVPHAIGDGLLLVEVQEPSDLLVRLEWSGYVVGAMPNDLGLGFPVALGAADRTAWDAARLATVRGRAEDRQSAAEDLLPAVAAPFFRLQRIRGDGAAWAAEFSILIVTGGSGEMTTADGEFVPLDRGDCWLVPWAAGSIRLVGDLEVVRCRPPEPSVIAVADPDTAERFAGTTSRKTVG